MERYGKKMNTINGGRGRGGCGEILRRPDAFLPSRSSYNAILPKPHYSSLPSGDGAAVHYPPRQTHLAEDLEISIFDAVRYFTEEPIKQTIFLGGGDASTITKDSSISSGEGIYGRTAAAATPTPSSEASWNSQSGLLTNPPATRAVSVHFKKMGSSSSRRRWICPCAGKKSIDVDENHVEPTTPIHSIYQPKCLIGTPNQSPRVAVISPTGMSAMEEKEITKMQICAGGWVREKPVFHGSNSNRFAKRTNFSFPVLRDTPPVPEKNVMEDPERDSLEVFRPLSRSPLVPVLAEDDVASDASSDLFEIESLSTYRRRDSPEHGSSASAARYGGEVYGYAPSEASVDWSVATAEGFDRASAANFSSAASDVGGVAARLARAEHERLGSVQTGFAVEPAGKRAGGLLGSCVCEKAVSVGPVPVRCVSSEVRKPAGSFFHVGEGHKPGSRTAGQDQSPTVQCSRPLTMFTR